MPVPSIYLNVDARVSVKPHFLRTTPVFGRLRDLAPLDAPGIRVFGTIVEATMRNGRSASMVKLDLLPDVPFPLLPGSLRYEGPRERRLAAAEETNQQPQPEVEAEEDEDFLEDAVAVPGEFGPGDDESAETETIDASWEQLNVEVDARMSRPHEAFQGRKTLHLPAKENASPAQYFLRFLPETHIQDVVLPAINQHAATVLINFEPITYEEYLVWIALFVIMTTVRMEDRAAYWHQGNCPFTLSMNFSTYMSMKRFNLISEMHVFVGPDAQL